MSHLTGARRATPPRAEAAALTTLTEHDAAPSAASARAAMLLLVLIGVACRGQARGDEPRAEGARHGRHCPSPGAWLPLTVCWIPPTRSGRTGHSDSAARAPGGHATPRTAEGENPEHDEMRGGDRAMPRGRRNERGGRMEQAEEARRSHEERRRLARIGRAWAGAAIGSAKCCSSGGEWRDGDDWRGRGLGSLI